MAFFGFPVLRMDGKFLNLVVHVVSFLSRVSPNSVLSAAGLVDEYHLYLRLYVLGGGKPYFAGPVPPLRLMKHQAIGEDAVRLTYVAA
jgi:hypothetical protein